MEGREAALYVFRLVQFVKLITEQIVRRVILNVGVKICIRINIRIISKMVVENERIETHVCQSTTIYSVIGFKFKKSHKEVLIIIQMIEREHVLETRIEAVT